MCACVEEGARGEFKKMLFRIIFLANYMANYIVDSVTFSDVKEIDDGDSEYAAEIDAAN